MNRVSIFSNTITGKTYYESSVDIMLLSTSSICAEVIKVVNSDLCYYQDEDV